MKFVIKGSFLIFICTIISFVVPNNKRVKVVGINYLLKETTSKNDTLYVVNFWSTWCDPCVKELPNFQSAYKQFAAKKVKMIYVSLNAPKDIASVEKFADAKNLIPEVLILNESNPNIWINEIDSTWSGTIPATAIYKDGKKIYFHEGAFTQEKLNLLIQSKLNKS